MRGLITIRCIKIGIVVLAVITKLVSSANAAAINQSGQTSGAETKQDVRKLELARPIEREMKGGEEHLYSIAIESGQYLDAVVEQRGIDVEVTVLTPDGKELFKVDSPNGTEGPEPVQLITESSGIYRFKVKSLEDNARPGRYEIRVNEVRKATNEDRASVERTRALLEATLIEAEAENLRVKGKYAEALSLANRGLSVREKFLGRDDPVVASSLNGIAMVYHDTGDYAKAEMLYQESLRVREKALGPNHPLVANSLNNIAQLYRLKGDYSKAEQCLVRAVEIRKVAFGEQNAYVANSLNNLADVYKSIGDYTKAELNYQQALTIREKALGSNHLYVAESLNSLANLHVEKGDYAKAEPLYMRSLGIREKVLGGQHPLVANTLIPLARVYTDEGDYAKAEPLFTRSLTILEKTQGSNHRDVANALDNLAGLYRTKGDLENAEPLYLRALTIRERLFGATNPEVATSVNDLALLYQAMRNYDKAEPLHKRALEISEKVYGPDHPEVAISLSNLALVYIAQDEINKAEPLLERALAILEKKFGADSEKLAIVLNNLSVLHQQRGDYEKAISYNQRALAINEKAFGDTHPLIATALSNLALAYLANGDVTNAIRYSIRNDDCVETDLVRNLASGSQRQKLAYLNVYAEDTDLAISLHVNSAPDSSDALRGALTMILRRKGRAIDSMTDSISTLRRRASADDQKLLDQLASVRSELSALSLRGNVPGGPEAYKTTLKSLQKQSENLESQISERSLEFRARLTPISSENVQKAVPQNAALVEFAVYRPINVKAAKKEDRFGKPRYVAYILRNTGDPSWVELGDTQEIDNKINAFRSALRNKRSQTVKMLAREVDSLVMQPVRRLLGQTRRVLISPDGALNLIPFAALADEHNQYLVRRFSFTYLSSGRDLLRLQTKIKGNSSKIVIADPDFGEKKITAKTTERDSELDDLYFSPLKATEEEASELKRLFTDATVLTKGQATEAALKAADRPAILHIATHGFFLDDLTQVQAGDEKEKTRIVKIKRVAVSATAENDTGNLINPLLRSGLGLAGANTGIGKDGNDGILTALEAAGLDLWGTKLVVLSACDTGVGKVVSGDGVYGLRRALILAGSESQMISLWPVSDTGTSQLMVRYYEALRSGAGRSEALRLVQLRMLKDPKFHHPFYWASFIQSGEWANLEGKR